MESRLLYTEDKQREGVVETETMDINKLQAFLCVAKHQNFTRAAEELFISQPALSKKIADFENEINVRLLDRDNRNVTLTPAGRALYAEAPVLLGVMKDLTHKIQDISRNQERQLSIACTGVEYDFFVPLFHAFRWAHPDIAVTLRWCTAPEVRHLLAANLIDLGFQLEIDASSEPNVSYFPLFEDRLDIVVSPYHSLAQADALKLEDLRSERLIAIRSSDKHLPFENILAYFRRNDIEFCGGISTVENLDALIFQVSTGMGVALLSSRAKVRHGGVLRFIPVDGESMSVQTCLAWNRGNTNPMRDVFFDFTRGYLGDL